MFEIFCHSMLTLTLSEPDKPQCINDYVDQGHDCSDFFLVSFLLFCKYIKIKSWKSLSFTLHDRVVWSFLHRHPNLAERHAEPIYHVAECRWLKTVCQSGSVMLKNSSKRREELHACNAIPQKQYNGDKIGFQLDPGRVLAPRNANVYSKAEGIKKQLTVLITTRADGKPTHQSVHITDYSYGKLENWELVTLATFYF